MISAWLYVLSFLTTFSAAFVKTFQQRNIVQGHVKTAFFTSWVITGLEIATIGFVVSEGWYILFSAGLGGAVGVVIAMQMHSRIFKKVTQ